jgi:hypothetical protein
MRLSSLPPSVSHCRNFRVFVFVLQRWGATSVAENFEWATAHHELIYTLLYTELLRRIQMQHYRRSRRQL